MCLRLKVKINGTATVMVVNARGGGRGHRPSCGRGVGTCSEQGVPLVVVKTNYVWLLFISINVTNQRHANRLSGLLGELEDPSTSFFI